MPRFLGAGVEWVGFEGKYIERKGKQECTKENMGSDRSLETREVECCVLECGRLLGTSVSPRTAGVKGKTS